MPPSSLRRQILIGACLASVFAALVARVEVLANDDAYIYFNYARNLVEGRPFAYDSRGIPSEGFTSLAFLGLLTPFQAAGTNMMFAASLLNLLAVAAAVGAGCAIARADECVRPGSIGLVAVVFLALLAVDDNVAEVIGRGLETMLGPAAVLLVVWFATLAVNRESGGRSPLATVAGFFASCCAALLIRPDNALPVGLAALLVLRRIGNVRSFWIPAAGFATVWAAYLAWKLAVFGGVFQTGYYRKIDFGPDGIAYVLGALREYAAWVAVWTLASVFVLLRGRSSPGRRRFSTRLLVFLALGTLVTFLPSRPLIGYAYRYLANAYVFLHLGVSLAVVGALDELLGSVSVRAAATLRTAAAVTISVLAILVAAGTVDASPRDFATRVNLHARAEQSAREHHYLRLGDFLRERIPRHEEITLVFGDAGALPYSFRSRFVDANGLTDPEIARLFREDDGPHKTEAYVEAILKWSPDLVVLAFGHANPEGVWQSVRNEHSPFRGPMPIEVFEAYREYGIEYLCSLRSYYDLHFGVRRDSPHFREIAEALLEYCTGRGYLLPDGLTVTEGGESVRFAPTRGVSVRRQ